MIRGWSTECPAEFPPVVNSWMTRFDHKGGNEWWVEVRFTKPTDWESDPSFVVWARNERSADWHRLELKPWGVYAGSFHIPPGERVQFAAGRAGSMSRS